MIVEELSGTVFNFLRRRKPPEEQEQEQQKVEASLQKTRKGFFGQIGDLFAADDITTEMWDDLLDLLVMADLGPDTVNTVLDEVERRVERENIKRARDVTDILKQELVKILLLPEQRVDKGMAADGPPPHPYVLLIVGVNGTGKTTSIAKLAQYYKHQRQDVILGAADTFRAAAVDQLEIWAERVGVPVVRHQPGADPSAVVFDAVAAAFSRNADVLIIDTAGRLHTKANLMEELRKLRRVAAKQMESAPHDVYLVIDATTGQNGLQQAKVFMEAVDVTGVVLTKLDGTAKGGIAFAIAKELGLPLRFIGTGEKLDDLAQFDARQFVDALFRK
jgi:fused signal recognition particle receptor